MISIPITLKGQNLSPRCFYSAFAENQIFHCFLSVSEHNAEVWVLWSQILKTFLKSDVA